MTTTIIHKSKKSKRGGTRAGSGRKKKEETKVIRVPKSKIQAIKELIKKAP